MGDISELRGLIFAVTFLGTLVLLISLIPPQFYVSGEHRSVVIPEFFDIMDIYQFAATKIVQMNETGGGTWWLDNSFYYVDVDIGGHDIDVFYKRPNYEGKDIFLIHFWYEWIVFPKDHRMTWYSDRGINRGTDLTLEELEADELSASLAKVSYRPRCDHVTIFLQIAYDDQTSTSFEDAWDDGGLYLFFGIDFAEVSTGHNAFQLVGMLLFFELPEVHWVINAVIAIPIWVTIVYLCYVLIIKIIPLIPGG